MKDILSSINESRTSLREIEKYAHDYITHSNTGKEYSDVIHAMINGMQKGCKENIKYLEDEQEQMDLEVLENVLTELSLKVPYGPEWNEDWIRYNIK